MKVLVCIPCLMTGGTEIQTLNLVQALIDGGHNVVTVCYFEYSDAMVSRFKDAGSEVVCLSPDGKRVSGLKGIIFLYKGLKKLIKEHRPYIAHVQYMAPGAIPIILLRMLGMRNIIATVHTAADIYPNLRLVHFIQKYCVRAFTCITELAEKSFFGSSQLYDDNLILKRRNHFTIHNALPKSFEILSVPKNFGNVITIGVVSRIEKIKGMDLVIPAYAMISRHHPGTRLIVVGDGTLKDRMAKQARELNCNSNITWAGRQPQEKLSDWYRQMNIVLMPSRSEGFGLTAIEAMAHGCIVVASRTGGLPEVVKDMETGLLHKPESVEDISEKVIALMNNPEQMERYSEAAVKAAGKYTFDSYSGLINNLYGKLEK